MKLAITGKGGVGKTTLASLLARVLAAEGKTVVAIDADPDANLAAALGFPPEAIARVTPIADLKDLVEERTGMEPGSMGGMFKLNPRVDDIPDRFAARMDGIRLLVMGTVRAGGIGCVCPESTLIKGLVRHLLLGPTEVVILDMEAGIEHLGRATASAVDAFIVVVEPGMRSIQTAETIRRLASDLGIKQCYVVGSKVNSEADRQFIADNLTGFSLLGFISYNPKIIEADLKGVGVFDIDSKAADEVRAIKENLENEQAEHQRHRR